MKTMQRIEQGERLKLARKNRGLAPVQVYSALDIPKSTYDQYESGRLGLSQVGERLANFLRVNLEWLLTGRGAMETRRPSGQIEIYGVVGAGSVILPIEDDTAAINVGDIQLPEPGSIGAVIIKGDSGYPRFQDGETLIFYTRQLRPSEVLNRQAIVQTWDGRKMIKTVRPYAKDVSGQRFTLESFNAPPEHNVDLMAAWAIYGLLFR